VAISTGARTELTERLADITAARAALLWAMKHELKITMLSLPGKWLEQSRAQRHRDEIKSLVRQFKDDSD